MSGRLQIVLRTAARDVRRHLRDPIGFLFWLGIPLLIGGLLVLVSGGREGPKPQAHLLVADEDRSVVSTLLIGALSQEAAGGIVRAERVDLADGRARMEKGGASALLLIPDGFGRSVLHEEPDTLRLWVNPSQSILPGMVEESLEILGEGVFYAHRIVGPELAAAVAGPAEDLRGAALESWVAAISVRFHRAVEGLTERLDPLPLRFKAVSRQEWEAAEAAAQQAAAAGGLAPGTADSLAAGAAGGAASPEGDEPTLALMFLPGILMMALLFMAQGISEDLWRERRLQTLRRFLATPRGAGTLLAGKVLAGAAFMGGISAVALVAGYLYFRLPAWTLPAAWAWTVLTGLMLLAGMALLQMHASSQRAGGLLTLVAIFPLMMLGGSFFPFEVMPAWMAAAGRFTPNGWSLLRLKEILVGGPGPQLLPAAAGLLAITALLFVLAARRLAGGFGRGAGR